MPTIETCPFWLYSYILWKGLYRNVRYICIILRANIIWRSGHAIRSSFLLDFSFLHHICRRVLMGTLFGSQIVLAIPKKWSRRTCWALRSVISKFKYSYEPENAKTWALKSFRWYQFLRLLRKIYGTLPSIVCSANLWWSFYERQISMVLFHLSNGTWISPVIKSLFTSTGYVNIQSNCEGKIPTRNRTISEKTGGCAGTLPWQCYRKKGKRWISGKRWVLIS